MDSYTKFFVELPIDPAKSQLARDEANIWLNKNRRKWVASDPENNDKNDYDLGFELDVTGESVTIEANEYGDIGNAMEIIGHLQEALEDDRPHIMTWAYTCSRPHDGGFGGGGALLRRGEPEVVLDAYSTLEAIRDRPANLPAPLQMLKTIIGSRWDNASDMGRGEWGKDHNMTDEEAYAPYEWAMTLYEQAFNALIDKTMSADAKVSKVRELLGTQWMENVHNDYNEYEDLIQLLLVEQWDSFTEVMIKG